MKKRRIEVLTHALIGILSVLAGISIGSFLAALIDPAFGPIESVSTNLIDLPPAEVKEFFTSTFGTNAKHVVTSGVIIVLAILAGIVGVLANKFKRAAYAMILIFGAVATFGALVRPTSSLATSFPIIITILITLITLKYLTKRATENEEQTNESRRKVLKTGTLIGGLSIGVFFISQYLRGGKAVDNYRAATQLPQPGSTLGALPHGVEAPVSGLKPFITPNSDFYRIDTAVVVPQVSPEDWKLEFTGMVSRPFSLTYDEILSLPLVERDITMMCVSNPVGGDYIGNARWLGTPLLPLLQQAGIDQTADQLFQTSVDGWTCSTPLKYLLDGSREPLLVIGMNGEPLPVEHGYPVRIVIPGLYGFISATKWVTKLQAATYADMPAYWTVRGWATDAPVLTGSRIDLPEYNSSISTGTTNIAGFAWAMNGDGISKVEVQIDEGPWQQVNLATEVNAVTWRQWWYEWDAQPGAHTISVRATNGEGALQDSTVRDVIPSGATGYDTIQVEVNA